jgi:radical SAM superfamily enzyme YgiQ (UPF0313 family)
MHSAAVKYGIYEKCIDQAKGDIVVINIDYTRSAENSLEILREFTKNLKERHDPYIILSGPLMRKNDPQTLREQFKKLPQVDAICYGEDEVTVPDACRKFLEGTDPGKVDGVGTRGKNSFKHSFVKDLGALPIPDYSDIRMKEYLNYRAGTPSLTIWASRGCPMRCVFCDETNIWHPYRTRSPESVAEEMRKLHGKYGTKVFRMNDLLLNGNMKNLNNLCEILKGNAMFFWGGMMRAEKTCNKILFKAMYEAGCRFVWFGIESYSNRMLKHMEKRIEQKQVIPIAKFAKGAGLKVVILLIDKFPGQTENDVKNTRELITMMKKGGCGYHVSNFQLKKYSIMGKNTEKFGLKINEDCSMRPNMGFIDGNRTCEGRFKENNDFCHWLLEGMPIITEF